MSGLLVSHLFLILALLKILLQEEKMKLINLKNGIVMNETINEKDIARDEIIHLARMELDFGGLVVIYLLLISQFIIY